MSASLQNNSVSLRSYSNSFQNEEEIKIVKGSPKLHQGSQEVFEGSDQSDKNI